ncbi:MAG TPA: pyridoxamine 5'-phosphate oxidase family protein [Actinomycetota bacterium]|nr:pyridoxamine 5'-phosphate oxidase family protein [Actinomycetota bacterium]
MPLPRSLLRMTQEELDTFLVSERTCRVATVSADGEPHVVPLWFVWQDGALYVTSLKRSRRTKDLERGSRVAVCVDAGEAYSELKGAVLYGTFEPAPDDEATQAAKRTFGTKYWGGIEMPDVRSHAWLVLRPDRIASWDFAKIPAGRDPRLRDRQ